MQKITDYGKVFETLIEKTAKYLVDNNIKAQILGISGGIDSTVVAAICHEVSKRTNIPLIGRSLPTKFNKEGEISAANLVGKVFCTDYKVANLNRVYYTFLSQIMVSEKDDASWTIDDAGHIVNVNTSDFQTPLANGNIQARLRMIYLYNLASIHKGLVMDTDNLTENNLGYFTIHGDVGDFNPIGGLWKTEVFELAKWLINHYKEPHVRGYNEQATAVIMSLNLKPTAGLGITDNDLEEIGAESYKQVDRILQDIIKWKSDTQMFEWYDIEQPLTAYLSICNIVNIPKEVIERVAKRHFASEFKRNQLPIKITHNEI